MATFRFTLRTPLTAVQFGTESVRNWQDVKPSIVKNKDYRGIFQTMTSTLEFTGVIRDLIIRTIDEYGYDAAIFLTIEIGNNNRERGSFQVFRGMENMIADISEIEITELAASLNFTESGFVADILSRGNMKVNIDVTETIDGDPLPPYEGLLRTIHLHDRKLIYESRYQKAGDSFVVPLAMPNDGSSIIGIPANYEYASGSDMNNIPALIAPGPISGRWRPEDRSVYSFLHNSEYGGEINVKGKIKGMFFFPPPGSPYLEQGWGLTGSFRWNINLIIRYPEEQPPRPEGGGRIARIVRELATGPDITVNNSVANFDAEFNETFEIRKGDSVSLTFEVLNNIGDPVTFEAHIVTDVVNYDVWFLGNYPDTKSKSILPHELFQRLLHITTGMPDAFYSEYFGRTDLGYQKDGDGAYLATLNGLMLRGFPDDKTKYNTSLKDAFAAFSKEKNLVGTIDIINGEQVFRVEPYEEIYTKHRAVKLGALSEVSRNIDFEKIFTSVTVGSADKEYEEVNGLYPFNGEFTFATPIKTTASELNLIGPYRKDDIGIELTRRQQYENDPNKDYRADKDIFIIDAAPAGFDPDSPGEPLSQPLLLANRGQDYITIEGIYEASRTYNIDLSPGRQLRLWGNVIASGLLSKGPGGGKLKFVKGGKNQDLVSHRQGEDEIVEAADVPISSLEPPIVLPDTIMIAEADMTFDQYKQMAENTTSLVEFENKGVQIFAYIRSAEFDFERNVCNFELERANY